MAIAVLLRVEREHAVRLLIIGNYTTADSLIPPLPRCLPSGGVR